jgi:hypothetical protein
MFRLFCGADPQVLGIADAEGNWDMAKFRIHIEECPVCSCGAEKMRRMRR